MLLCIIAMIYSCCDMVELENPNVKPPIEEPDNPEEPEEKPLIDGSIFNIQINDEIMATLGTGNWNSITFGNGKYVAVNTNAQIAYSTNGINWTIKNIGVENVSDIHCIKYLNGKFIACSNWGTSQSRIWLYSTDGINWYKGGWASGIGSSFRIADFSYNDGEYIAVGSNIYCTSYDGISWTNRSTKLAGGESIALGAGKYVTIYKNNIYYRNAVKDSNEWTKITVNSSKYPLSKIAYGNGKFIAIGAKREYFEYILTYATSSDGVNWNYYEYPANTFLTSTGIYALTFDKGWFVAIAYNNILFSEDGANWKNQSNTNKPRCVCIMQ